MAVFELETLMTLVNLCKEAIATRKWLMAKQEAIEERQLSQREADILHAAAKGGVGNGRIQVIRSASGHFVFAGGKQFGESSYEVAKHLDAFYSLCDRGLVRHTGGTRHDGTLVPSFQITGEAFDLDRELHG